MLTAEHCKYYNDWPFLENTFFQRSAMILIELSSYELVVFCPNLLPLHGTWSVAPAVVATPAVRHGS